MCVEIARQDLHLEGLRPCFLANSCFRFLDDPNGKSQTSVYSGTVASALEAFFHGVPYLSLSYECNVDDFVLAAKACMPIITAKLAEIKNNTYPQSCFLNIDVPADVANRQITVAHLGALSPPPMDDVEFFKGWLPGVHERISSSS
ncbi:hypothetical protein CQW23_14419 [Capsicum baccatum]|uniref:Survival protein SurE-like phosphatase/nucleotidase domain-containing protein n=1 Tax=Capsicum baccatum TaxID=33114 RepID=A0A2G2WJ47_CAPBA|nr:hypothetical protein CQW23_14419 [Capsicum baccatum]